MPAIPLDKNYREAADVLMHHVKNATREEKLDEQLPDTQVIEIIGDFEIFDISDMDMWGGHFKFVIRDTEAKTNEEIEIRGEVAMQLPQLAAYFTSKAGLLVYRLVTVRTTDREEWEEITREFVRRADRSHMWSEE